MVTTNVRLQGKWLELTCSPVLGSSWRVTACNAGLCSCPSWDEEAHSSTSSMQGPKSRGVVDSPQLAGWLVVAACSQGHRRSSSTAGIASSHTQAGLDVDQLVVQRVPELLLWRVLADVRRQVAIVACHSDAVPLESTQA